MQTIELQSWNEFNERVYEGAWNPALRRYRSNLAFRGAPDAGADLRSGLLRLNANPVELETHLLRNFRKYAHRQEAIADSVWDWLALGQHHGLPTRLLDWTYSPFIAAHFVTADMTKYDRDGALWCVDFVKTNQLLPERLKSLLNDEGSAVFTVELLARAADSLEEFDRFAFPNASAPEPRLRPGARQSAPEGPRENFVVFFEPPSLDDRMLNQYALFSMMSSPATRLDDWLDSRRDLCRKLIIPAKLKWEFRDKLDQANINERVLFPGLDGLSQWLMRHYTPRPE